MNGVLLIHGFGGSRTEVDRLGEYLTNKGYTVEMPCLTGHEGSRKDLAKASYLDWISDVERAYEKLSKKCDNIAVIGFSMGGLLAVQLYQTKRFDKLVTVNTPVFYWNFRQIFKNIIKDFKTHMCKYLLSGKGLPVSAMFSFQRLLTKTKPLFKTVDCPALIVQAQDDDTVKPKSADYIFSCMTNISKRIYTPEQGGHIIFQSDSFSAIAEEIAVFL